MGSTPSERTIESLSNHGFLDVLNQGKTAPPFAWFLLPTQVEEYFLGYDADLAAHKRIYIQYKRMSDKGRFDFGFRQLWAMAAHLERYTKPYVLLSGNIAKSYADIATFHTAPGASRHEAFNRTFFLDAWDVIQKVCEAVYGGPISPFPTLLPIPPATSNLGFVGLTEKPGATFDINITLSGSLVHEVTNLLLMIGFPPMALTAPHSTNVLGWGAGFAEAAGVCHFGKPAEETTASIVKARWRETFEQSNEDERRRLRRMSVLTLPMPG